jgi:hypothetical protein
MSRELAGSGSKTSITHVLAGRKETTGWLKRKERGKGRRWIERERAGKESYDSNV